LTANCSMFSPAFVELSDIVEKDEATQAVALAKENSFTARPAIVEQGDPMERVEAAQKVAYVNEKHCTRDSPAHIKLSNLTGKDEVIQEMTLVDEKDRTTVAVKNLPRHYTMQHLYQELCDLGFADGINYMNLLEDRRKEGRNRGYAFVNFQTHQQALDCMTFIRGHNWKRIEDPVAVILRGDACWARVQGYVAHNTKHPMVPVAYRETLEP